MISSSSAYKTQLNSNALSPKIKIVVDEVEYLGDVIKDFPSMKHSSTKIIGTFPAKTISFNIYDLENEIDFENKEIEVYKGLVVNNSIEYLKQGIFIPKAADIKTNISEKTITFSNIQDRTQLLEDTYSSSLDWSNNQTHTGLEIIQEICTSKNITLKNNNFAFANYSFRQPNFSESITYRGVIAAMAEIGGEIAIFDSNGELEIKGQNNVNQIMQRKRYEKLSYEKPITINTVVLGKDGVDDDIVYPEEIETERVEIKILDNPFVDLYREQMIEDVANYIIGLSYIPFQVDGFVDGYMYELNDVITILDRNNNSFNAVILDIENTSRIKSKILAPKLEDKKTEYNLAGSNKESVNQVKLEVDHIKNEVRSVVSEVTETQNNLNLTNSNVQDINTRLQNDYLSSEEIDALQSHNDEAINLLKEQYTSLQQVSTQVQIQVGSILSDGVNKIRTATGYTFDENGLNIAKEGTEISNTLDNTGMYVKRNNTDEILGADTSGVRTENLLVRGKFVMGSNSRFEDYKSNRTGCFFVGE